MGGGAANPPGLLPEVLRRRRAPARAAVPRGGRRLRRPAFRQEELPRRVVRHRRVGRRWSTKEEDPEDKDLVRAAPDLDLRRPAGRRRRGRVRRRRGRSAVGRGGVRRAAVARAAVALIPWPKIARDAPATAADGGSAALPACLSAS